MDSQRYAVIHTNTNTHTCMCTHACIHTHARTHARTHAHTETHLHFCSSRGTDFGIVHSDLSFRHLVETLVNDVQALAHLLHPTEVPGKMRGAENKEKSFELYNTTINEKIYSQPMAIIIRLLLLTLGAHAQRGLQ